MNMDQEQPYYAVIFTSIRTDDDQGYNVMSNKMLELAKRQEGFLGVDSARETVGITVSYWNSLANIKKWKAQVDHTLARQLGKERWYSSYSVRICKVMQEYSFQK